jgi:transcriptional regulator with XRE-family HTH domain
MLLRNPFAIAKFVCMRLLDFYRTLNRSERADFAKRIGTSQAYLGQLAHGHRLPGMELAFRIVRESCGLVDAHEDSFGPSRQPTAEAA